MGDLSEFWVTPSSPVRHIHVDGKPYLSRYMLGGYEPSGTGQVWLHEFHTADGDEFLHNHPWRAESKVLRGGYVQEIVGPYGVRREHRTTFSVPADIGPETYHRIVEVEPGTITLLKVEPGRLPHWYFLDSNGHLGCPTMRQVNGKPVLKMPPGWKLRARPSGGEDWWKKYCPS